MTVEMVLEHLYIVFMAVIMAIAVGVPLGVITYLVPKARKIILFVTDVFQTIPSLALLGLIMILVGAGKTTVIIGLTMYSLLPIVRNTIDIAIREIVAVKIKFTFMTRMPR